MKTQKRPQFFAIYKNFNSKEFIAYDVLASLFDEILTPRDRINKKSFYIWEDAGKTFTFKAIPVTTREQCKDFIERHLMYHFWAKCEWEMICVDWPYREDSIEQNNPVKIDVWDQLKPNIEVITDLVWNYVEPKIK